MNRSNFFFALDEDGHAHWRIAFPDLQRSRVNSDTCLVISGATANRRPERSVGSKGDDSQSSSGPAAGHRDVRREEPGVPPALEWCRTRPDERRRPRAILTSLSPERSSQDAATSADSRTRLTADSSALTDGMRTRLSRSARIPPKARSTLLRTASRLSSAVKLLAPSGCRKRRQTRRRSPQAGWYWAVTSRLRRAKGQLVSAEVHDAHSTLGRRPVRRSTPT